MKSPDRQVERVQNVGGGVASAMSLAQLSSWCAIRFGKHTVGRDSASRPYDIPWMVLDSAMAERQWDWQPTVRVTQILEEIAQHAEAHPEWLGISGCI
jgi:CDP-paratose 2-epimerase